MEEIGSCFPNQMSADRTVSDQPSNEASVMRSTGNDIRTTYCECRSNVRASVSQDRRHGIAFEGLKLRILHLGIKPGANDTPTQIAEDANVVAVCKERRPARLHIYEFGFS
jgi:hypothetical protein